MRLLDGLVMHTDKWLAILNAQNMGLLLKEGFETLHYKHLMIFASKSWRNSGCRCASSNVPWKSQYVVPR